MQCITFGGNNPVSLHLTMNHVKLEWGNALKYLGCLFQVNSCRVDIRQQVRNTTEILTTSCQCWAVMLILGLKATLLGLGLAVEWPWPWS